MSLVYGLTIGLMFYLNVYSETLGRKAAVFIVTAVISFIFGAMAARGIA